MKKPLSAEKVLHIIDRGDLSPETIICLLRDEIMRGHVDADAPAFDVDGLINSFSQRILYLQGLNKARKSNDPKYFEAETIIRELSNQIVLIKQKLKKEPEVQKEDEIMSEVKGVRKTLPVEMGWTYFPDCNISAQIYRIKK